ncbi:hypothetical protein HYS28_03590 [Candidatus Uhrbacteria bacterium]|nr:hypothetical protein [Candidatus Uhrbacteria bacterium]
MISLRSVVLSETGKASSAVETVAVPSLLTDQRVMVSGPIFLFASKLSSLSALSSW